MMKPFFACLLLLVAMSCGNEEIVADTDSSLEVPAADTPTPSPAAPSEEDITVSDIDDDDPYLVSNGYFLGLTPGGSLAEFIDGLRSDVLQTGEGDFDVHYIDGAKGDELGYVMADPRDEGTIGNIYITSSKVVTENGARVGMSYSELVEKMGELEVHGSEIEGRTYAISDGLSFRLDAGNWSYEIDPSTIKPDTKVIEIVVER